MTKGCFMTKRVFYESNRVEHNQVAMERVSYNLIWMFYNLEDVK